MGTLTKGWFSPHPRNQRLCSSWPSQHAQQEMKTWGTRLVFTREGVQAGVVIRVIQIRVNKSNQLSGINNGNWTGVECNLVWNHTRDFKIEQARIASSIWNHKYDFRPKLHNPKFNCYFIISILKSHNLIAKFVKQWLFLSFIFLQCNWLV